VRRRALVIAAMLTVVGLAACHSGSEGGGLISTADTPRTPLDVAGARVETFAPALTSMVAGRADAAAHDSFARALVNGGAELEDVDASLRGLVVELYTERGHGPVLVSPEGLTPSGEAVLAALEDSWAHGLWPSDYGVETARGALEALRRAHVALVESETFALTAQEREALAEALAQRPELLERDDTELTVPVLDMILSPGEGYSPAPTALAAYQRRVEARQGESAAAARAELALAVGFLRYAWDQRFSNPHWFPAALAEDPPALREAQREAMREAFRQGVELGFGDVLAALPPHYEQYGRLVEAHRRYRGFVAAGGWATDLEEVELRPGASHDVVPRLRERLAAEGYFEGDLTSRVFDSAIREAYQHYQHTHQFDDNGQLRRGEVRSLNVSALDRAQQIAVTLQRWRESWITDDPTFIFVNVPDFHAEVWRDGVRDMRFRIIVGSTQRIRSRTTGELTYARATPDVHELLRYVVFNPYWNVPQGIMMEEYDPHLVENPNWYEENGYEVLYNQRGNRWVRQLPGPQNALGVVKFLFPNEHDVYLHDTPNRHLFRRAQRTFSHGCMRVEDPMELAYYLMWHDRGWDRERVDQVRGFVNGALPHPLPNNLWDRWFSLRTPIPVHVEYYVVRVDDDGWTHFNGDIYRRNVERIEERARREMDEIARVAVGRVTSGVGASVLSLGEARDRGVRSAHRALEHGQAAVESETDLVID
jgi:L,D-transpeptidase YcbB